MRTIVSARRLAPSDSPNPAARGNSLFNQIVSVIGDDEQVRDSQDTEPLLIDIQPFKRTRLLACVSLENVRRFAIARLASEVDTLYESKSRSALKAPKTSYGFYYSTEPVKVNLPYKATGEMVPEVTAEESAGAGCEGHGDNRSSIARARKATRGMTNPMRSLTRKKSDD